MNGFLRFPDIFIILPYPLGNFKTWLWDPFIPYGKHTIVQGDPGDGKTTLVLNIAAKLSQGEPMDDEMRCVEPINIIYQTAEDGLADTVKPRLESASADCSI